MGVYTQHYRSHRDPYKNCRAFPWETLGLATKPQGMNTTGSHPFLLRGLRKDTRKLVGPGEVTPNRWPLTPLEETGVSTCSYSHVWGIQKGVSLETTIVLVHVDSMVRVI